MSRAAECYKEQLPGVGKHRVTKDAPRKYIHFVSGRQATWPAEKFMRSLTGAGWEVQVIPL